MKNGWTFELPLIGTESTNVAYLNSMENKVLDHCAIAETVKAMEKLKG